MLERAASGSEVGRTNWPVKNKQKGFSVKNISLLNETSEFFRAFSASNVASEADRELTSHQLRLSQHWSNQRCTDQTMRFGSGVQGMKKVFEKVFQP